MRHINRKNVTRFSALLLVMLLLCSFTASYAASFGKSAAGIKYKSKKYMLGSTISESKLKSAFGKWSSRKSNGSCYCGVVYSYTFKKGIKIDLLLKKKTSKSGKIVAITVSSKTFPTVGGMKIGDKTSTLKSKFGSKYSKNGSTRHYSSGKYDLYVYTKSNKVTKFKLSYDI